VENEPPNAITSPPEEVNLSPGFTDLNGDPLSILIRRLDIVNIF
jgi:hypothetical protein